MGRFSKEAKMGDCARFPPTAPPLPLLPAERLSCSAADCGPPHWAARRAMRMGWLDLSAPPAAAEEETLRRTPVWRLPPLSSSSPSPEEEKEDEEEGESS